ncbi:membrane protein [Burkholderia lata]|uniref:phospholipase D-like domain-containing protein n=1 Tax=Burkholderia lata (strain ATCC 17760 / DSM 23089 / LMG 22485 / NCIMB 9086 / R18194 / 383) TaxID=482957 RepID=UPI001454126F|nr:phospholipase D-like domain-containing protein [Burkholderia lata]VWD31119.1 membrane protein [Burkholderia lata]
MSDDDQRVIDKWKRALSTPVTEGNRVEYLIDGKDTYVSMYDAIGTTFTDVKENGFYIYILGWWLDDTLRLKAGDPRSTLHQLLIKAAACNVQIRVILWDNLFQRLAPTIVGAFNSHAASNVKKLTSGVGLLDVHPLSIFGSHHQKIIVVKGSQGIIGFCGGVDISQDRLTAVDKHKGSPYHDVHCRIQGDGARGLLDVFVQRWTQHPDHSKWDKPFTQGGKGALLGLNDVNGSNEEATGASQLVAIGRTFNRRVDGKGCASDRSVFDTLKNAIATSSKFIYIEDQYLVSLRIADLLQKRLAEIDHLLILIPHSNLSDLPNIRAARSGFVRILQKDKKLYEEKVGIFYRVDPVMKVPTVGSYVHAKTWVFDDELAVIGSANINERGLSFDSEVIAAIFDKAPSPAGKPSFAQSLRVALWKKHLGLSSDADVRLDSSAEDSWNMWATVTKDTKDAAVLKYTGIDSPDPSGRDSPPSSGRRVGFDNVEDTSYSNVPDIRDSLYNAYVDQAAAVNLGRCSKPG